MGKELHSWEAVLSTQMESTSRPSEGECTICSDSVVQRKRQIGSRGQNHRYFATCLLGNVVRYLVLGSLRVQLQGHLAFEVEVTWIYFLVVRLFLGRLFS